MALMQKITDGFASLLSGIGTAQDKNAANGYVLDGRFCASYVQAEVAYRTSWLVRKGHDLPPFDMTREWRRWQADDGQIEKLEAEEKRLDLKRKVRMALIWARLYGGGALILGFKARLGQPSDPLDLSRITTGDLEFVHVVSRHQISYTEIDKNPLSATRGLPKMWSMSGGAAVANIHPSRVVPFIGQPVPTGAIGADQFWGDPLLTSVWDAVTNADLVQAIIPALLQVARTRTLKVPGFMSQIGTAEYEQRFMKRVQLDAQSQSLLNTSVIDAEEDIETTQVSFADLTDIERQKLMIAAAAFNIPATKFLGESAKGMNATGQGDEDNYNAEISSQQENDLQPTMEPVLDEALIRSALGARPANVRYVWAPLAEVEPKEAAEIEKLEAETVAIYAKENIVPPDALATTAQNRLMESGRWPGLEQAIAESKVELDFDPVEEPDPSALTQGVEPEVDTPRRSAANDAAPRTLYVRRDVLNHAEITAWAKGQGFATTVGEKMHVTVLYSKTPVDWIKMGENWSGDGKGNLTLQPGGPRVVEPLGPNGAIVLLFSSTELQWRHRNMIEAGASSDFSEYTAHTTITWDLGDVDLAKVVPYRGPILLGPEIFEEIKEDWRAGLIEDAKPTES